MKVNMPTPSKPFEVLSSEKKSHRTKAELALRRDGESELISGKKLKENKDVKADPVAHAEFMRLNKILKSIKKNDDIYNNVINRYCKLVSEVDTWEHEREEVKKTLETLAGKAEKLEGDDLKVFMQTYEKTIKSLATIEKTIESKRKALFDIEKENVMTIASSLRSIPKKVESKKSNLAKILSG